MPRNVRNSWVELRVDGRSSTDETGPRAKDGTMTALFYVRHDNAVKESVRVETFAKSDGELALHVYHPELGHVLADVTQRDDNVPERTVELRASTRAMLREVHDRIIEQLYEERDWPETRDYGDPPSPEQVERIQAIARVERKLNDVCCDMEKLGLD